jgi:hypothetical protein
LKCFKRLFALLFTLFDDFRDSFYIFLFALLCSLGYLFQVETAGRRNHQAIGTLFIGYFCKARHIGGSCVCPAGFRAA